jgi:transaldolase
MISFVRRRRRSLAARDYTAADRIMLKTPLHALHDAGQSIWLDYIDRSLVRGGELSRRIERDALTGMTSNPTIFEKALTDSDAYDDQLASAPPTHTSWELFEMIATDDVRDACDVFRGVYETSGHADGFVSIEVSPSAAHDVEETLTEARRLWTVVDRPNVMIKVPGTRDGATAARRLIAEGINVNITLLFALEAHADIIEAYLSGLEERVRAGKPVDRLASVASFFVSRVDTEVDKRIDARMASISSPDAARLRALRGRIAIANAKLAYALFQERFSGQRWEALRAKGARVQRPLWASTSTKNPAYRDVMYVEALIGPDTVDTMPPQTIDAFRDHGVVARTVDADVDRERRAIAELEALGISLVSVTDKLLVDGLASFQKSFDGLLERLEQKAVER